MNSIRRYAYVLALYLNSRGFAFVLFESALSPYDWGVKEVRGRRRHVRCLAKVTALFDLYEPAVLVLQDTSVHGTPRTCRIVKLNEAIRELANGRQMLVYAYSRGKVWEAFEEFGVSNKHDIAMVIATRIPAFERYVPSPRKPWKSEDARMGIFDAAGLGLAFFQRAG